MNEPNYYYIEQVLCEEHLEFRNVCSVLTGIVACGTTTPFPTFMTDITNQLLLCPDAFGYDL